MAVPFPASRGPSRCCWPHDEARSCQTSLRSAHDATVQPAEVAKHWQNDLFQESLQGLLITWSARQQVEILWIKGGSLGGVIGFFNNYLIQYKMLHHFVFLNFFKTFSIKTCTQWAIGTVLCAAWCHVTSHVTAQEWSEGMSSADYLNVTNRSID